MRLPLMIDAPNRVNHMGPIVRVAAGDHAINWDCDSTVIAISIDGDEFQSFTPTMLIALSKPTGIQLKILKPGINPKLSAYVTRHHNATQEAA